jgi:UDP-N-acetylglucosamine diphosphorylase/glucosamine-1-phosphate N-acetyltransferase
MMQQILFEDAPHDFYPLCELRPQWQLRTGLGTLEERLAWRLGRGFDAWLARPELGPLLAEQQLAGPAPGPALCVNARLLELDPADLEALKPGEALVRGEVILAARLDLPAAVTRVEDLAPLVRVRREAPEGWEHGSHLWDLVCDLPRHLERDWRCNTPITQPGGLHPTVVLQHPERICIAEDARIGAYTVIDARGGPVVIGSGTELMPFCYIQGPCFIGPDCRLKAHTRVYEGCHLGPVCRVAGELAESVIQGYSNKQHDGFLGHAYLGEWCNLGADTNNSDLKNNYGNVVVTLKGRPVKTGRRFVGLMMGDHSKTAINTMFNTGTVVGIFANIWGGGFPQTEVPPFSWGGPPGGFVPYRVDKALETARVVVDRRGKTLSPALEDLVQHRAREAGQSPR